MAIPVLAGRSRTPAIISFVYDHSILRRDKMSEKLNVQDLPVVDLDGPSKLGFARTCLICAVIDLAELKIWAENLIVEQDEPHTILFDILDFNDSKPQFFSLLSDRLVRGPCSPLRDGQLDALAGIRFLRDPNAWQEDPGQKVRELASLDRHPEVLDAFRTEFPFIDIE